MSRAALALLALTLVVGCDDGTPDPGTDGGTTGGMDGSMMMMGTDSSVPPGTAAPRPPAAPVCSVWRRGRHDSGCRSGSG